MKVNDYRMPNSEGNNRIHNLLMTARRQGWDWDTMVRHLNLLSKVPGFEDARALVVRRAVEAEFNRDYV